MNYTVIQIGNDIILLMETEPAQRLGDKPTSGYIVNIPVYEGPLDLLLQLIEHAELDITVIALAQVTDQFLEYLQHMLVSPDEISAFMVIAAKLLQIKSEALLPRPPVHDQEEDNVGESLARQLRTYKLFKEIAIWLDERQKMHLHAYLRIAPLIKVEGKLDLSNISLSDLKSAAATIFAQEQNKQDLGSVITPPRITIREKISVIVKLLHKEHQITFDRLLSNQCTRLEIVVTFLALLELVKRYRVSTRQDKPFSEIMIEKLDGWNFDEEIELEFE